MTGSVDTNSARWDTPRSLGHRARATLLRVAAILAGLGLPFLFSGRAWAAANSGASGIETSTRLAVVALTIGLLVAAVVAARRALRSPHTTGLMIDQDLLDIDLFDLSTTGRREPGVVLTFERVLLVLLAGYAIADRGFAWIHVPGTPLFLGEMVLALGVLAAMSIRVPIAAARRVSPAFKVLLVWMGWGLIFLVLSIPEFGLDAIRDSAIWYYGTVAVLVATMMMSDPSRFGRWSRLYTKVMPIILLWFPIAMALDYQFGHAPPLVPDSAVPFFAHRWFNMAILSAMFLAFIWLVDLPWGQLTPTKRVVYSSVATLVILTTGFQTRGGLLAAVLGIAVMFLFMRGRRAELILASGTVILALAAIAVIADVSIPISNSREISAAQMIDNIGSVIDPSSGESRQQGTTQWRLELWTAVLDDVVTEHPVAGFGPGPNLGERYGVETNEAVPLRNPHNSHLGVLSRMGLVGVALWATLWVSWVFQLLILRGDLLRRGRSTEAGLAAWLVVAALMMLVNAVFDPTLEGPQVAFWLWAVFGLGVALPVVYSGVVTDRLSIELPTDGPRTLARTSLGSLRESPVD